MLNPELVKNFSKEDFHQHFRTPFCYKIGNDYIHNQVAETTIIKSAWIASACYLVTRCIQTRSIKPLFSPSLIIAIGVGASTFYYNAFVARCRTHLTVNKLRNNFENDLMPKDLLLTLRNCWKENATMCLVTAFNLYTEKEKESPHSALSKQNKPVIIDSTGEPTNLTKDIGEIIIEDSKKCISSLSVLIATLIILNKKPNSKINLDLNESNFTSKIHDPQFLAPFSTASRKLFTEAQNNPTGFNSAVTELVSSNS